MSRSKYSIGKATEDLYYKSKKSSDDAAPRSSRSVDSSRSISINRSSDSSEMHELSRKITKLISVVGKLDMRLTRLEAEGKEFTGIKSDLEGIKSQMIINDFAINADDHLNQYLMEIKEQEAIEMAVTDKDIQKGSKKINSRRTNRK
jgi:hypothetical protein